MRQSEIYKSTISEAVAAMDRRKEGSDMWRTLATNYILFAACDKDIEEIAYEWAEKNIDPPDQANLDELAAMSVVENEKIHAKADLDLINDDWKSRALDAFETVDFNKEKMLRAGFPQSPRFGSQAGEERPGRVDLLSIGIEDVDEVLNSGTVDAGTLTDEDKRDILENVARGFWKYEDDALHNTLSEMIFNEILVKVSKSEERNGEEELWSWQKDYPENRSDMEASVEWGFVQKCFETYEKSGFCDTFETCDSDLSDRNGEKFTVLGRASLQDVDLEAQPMFNIRFADGTIIAANPSEITKTERIYKKEPLTINDLRRRTAPARKTAPEAAEVIPEGVPAPPNQDGKSPLRGQGR